MAKTEETKAVATVDEAKPSYLQALESKGPARLEDNFDSSDMVIPRIKLLQGISPEITAHDAAKSGEFWHSGFEVNLGPEVTFVVLARRKKYLLVPPMDDGQGVLARADDAHTWNKLGSWDVCLSKKLKKNVRWEINDLDVAKSGLAEWGTSNPEDPDSPPAATLFYDYVVAIPERMDLGLAVISLARSSITPAKKGLNDKIKLHADHGRPMQALQFRAKCVGAANEAGQDFNNWAFSSAGFVTSEELFNRLMAISESLGEFRVQDEEGAAADDRGGTNENAHKDKEF